ncbi:eukaryotic translation initiation factor 5B-like [Coffea arabica]|uniref:Eukaryotic translation initiation factor 5B n=1 Tax=Coffea arabica TaxID=13443 RepID=A0A6P6SSJ9_COFAR|nr:eukaryotic translation initiation factor 5B-like [Coffea arabica]
MEEKNKAKVLDKKVPKHVREIQEKLAKLKEIEERKKREEEEKLKKEEEERLRQEELERIEEEKKRLKKERKKEKMLKKKQEGKLLTRKQKEEARRLESMRNQFLANADEGLLLSSEGNAKRPVCQTKNPKLKISSLENQGTEAMKENEDEDDQDQKSDAKSWDDFELDGTQDAKRPVYQTKNPKPNISSSENQDTEVEKENADEGDQDQEWDAKNWDDFDLDGVEHDAKPEAEGVEEFGPRANSVEEEAPESNSLLPVPCSQDVSNGLRSPICCILGHVDSGKTKLLDCIRSTKVQEGEAGGITQQIGATFFPVQNIRKRTKELKADAKLNVPGLLVIDTPGHESFANLRSRGSGLCDIAILVVDIMHGLEPLTIESLSLLKMRGTEFIVALNKVDRLYGWKICPNAPILKAMKQQSKDVHIEFGNRLNQVIAQFKEQGLNTELYYKNKEMGETFSIVPTSAITGEGIPDLLLLLVQWAQKTMIEKLTYQNQVQGIILEVKVVEGYGTTIDVVLVNGVLREGDRIVVCGMKGPILTNIRAILTPHPMKELRVKGVFVHHKEIKAAQGIKIAAQGLKHAIAGTEMHVLGPDDDLEYVKEAAMEDMRYVMNRIGTSSVGVHVQASTLGSLEALLEFLKTPGVNVPVSNIGVGPVHERDVRKVSVMIERKKEYATVLAFDVVVKPKVQELAQKLGVKILRGDIIYHLVDQFKAITGCLNEEKKKADADDAIFPCRLKPVPKYVFNKKDPIVLGVEVVEGTVKVGTPICVAGKELTDVGRIASIENNKKPVDYAKEGQMVAIKIVGSNPGERQKMLGRHFEIEDELVSHISRRSIDILKANYRESMSSKDWCLVKKLKILFKIK